MDDEPTTLLVRDLATRIAAAIPEAAQLDIPQAGLALFVYENGEALFWTSTTDHTELEKVLRRFLADKRG